MKKATTHLPLFAIVLTLAALLAVPGAASAKPLGKDGKIHACYKVRGKQKGALRVLGGAQARCRRGERKLAWGAVGLIGPQGQPGQPGAAGAAGASPDVAALEAKIAGLTVKVASLEAVLGGISNTELLAALDSLADVQALCDQATKLTDQANLLRDTVGGLSLNAVLTALGGLLDIPATLPQVLPAFSCP